MTHKIFFFPFTHISQDQLNTILTFFPSFHYLPVAGDLKQDPQLQKPVEQGKILPLFFSSKALLPVELKFEEYLAWARIHKGNEHNLKSLLKDNPYFTSDTNVTAIKSQIKGIKNGSRMALPGESPLERALLFLKMAQLCDKQNESIDLELKNLDKTRDKLVSTLRGLESPPIEVENKKKGMFKDPGAMMTRERINAWFVCMAQKEELKKEESRPLFITTSEAVFKELESNCKDVVNALDIDKIKVHENECENKTEWQHHFYQYLMGAIQGDGNRKNQVQSATDKCSVSGQIKLHLFPGNGINKCFNMSDKHIPVCLIKLK
jgi:hypothetical protein